MKTLKILRDDTEPGSVRGELVVTLHDYLTICNVDIKCLWKVQVGSGHPVLHIPACRGTYLQKVHVS
jgi:hypothetical protein